MDITREQFERERSPRFGSANPERMAVPFWEWMIRGGDEPAPDDGSLLGGLGLVMREGVLRSACGPWRARDLFNAPPSSAAGPVWTFDRMGQSRTELPDGRVVWVAGEHEDYYDPDFHIYNDVVVLTPEGEIEIYGYPRDVFPPTDFHTATPDGDRLVIVGALGYSKDRVPGETPVYALDLTSYRIDRLHTMGQAPGWISSHEAEFDAGRRVVTVRDGEVQVEHESGRRFRRNVEEYELDLRTLVWRRTTDRDWPQFVIRRTDGKFFGLDHWPDFKTFRPTGASRESLPDDEGACRLAVRGVTVHFATKSNKVEITIEGALPAEAVTELIAAAHRHVTAAAGYECAVDAF